MRTNSRGRKLASVAWRITLLYAGISALWIWLSGWLLMRLVRDPALAERLEIYKGWVFVAVTSLLLYLALRSYLARADDEAFGRRRAEDALGASEARFRSLVEQAPDALLVHDRNGRFLDANRRATESLGYTKEELLQMTVMDVGEDYDLPKAQAIWDGIKPGEGRVLFGRQRRKDGTRFPGEIRVGCFEAKGERLYVGLVRDITDRQLAEAAIQERLKLEKDLSKLAATAPGVIYSFRWKPDGSMFFSYASPSVETLFGFSPEQIVGDAQRVFQLVHPEDLQRIYGSIRKSGEDLSPWREEFRVRHPRKGEIWLEGRAVPEREAEGGTLWHGFFYEITQRKRADEARARLAAAVEQAAEAIVITDPHGTILYINPAFEKITGYAAREVLGQNPRILKSGKHDAAYYATLWSTLNQGEVWSGRMTNRRKDGSLYQEETTISPVHDSTGKIVNYVAVKRDVTQEEALEAQLRQSQKMEAIGLLAGGVAHDFNNLLTVIRGHASLLAGGKLDSAENADCSQQIIRAADRATDLVRQLLLFSRKQVMQPANLDLNEIVAGMTKMLKRLLGEDVAFSSELASNLPPIFAPAHAASARGSLERPRPSCRPAPPPV